MLHGLFEGAQYNSEAGAKCAVYSRARTKRGRGVIKEIRYVKNGKEEVTIIGERAKHARHFLGYIKSKILYFICRSVYIQKKIRGPGIWTSLNLHR